MVRPAIPDRLILHPSVLARLWCPFLDYAENAERLWERLKDRRIDAYVPEDMAIRILAECERALRENDLPTIQQQAVKEVINITGLARSSITSTVDGFIWNQVLHVGRNRPLERLNVWGIHTRFHIRLPDALFVWMAMREGMSLIIADATLRQQLQTLCDAYPDLRQDLKVIWLPDYI